MPSPLGLFSSKLVPCLDAQDSVEDGDSGIERLPDMLEALHPVFRLGPGGGEQFVFAGEPTDAAEKNLFRGWYCMI
jgi:hypothetical protein